MQFIFMSAKALMIDYNQFRDSKLQPIINKVLKCGNVKAFNFGKAHCNSITTWAILYLLELFAQSYEEFFRRCLQLGAVDEYGYFFVDKIDIDGKPGLFTMLGIQCKVTKYTTIPEDIKAGDLFQIAVNDKHHFMLGVGAEDGNIYLFDTNDRPYGEELIKALMVKGDRITWIKRYEKVV